MKRNLYLIIIFLFIFLSIQSLSILKSQSIHIDKIKEILPNKIIITENHIFKFENQNWNLVKTFTNEKIEVAKKVNFINVEYIIVLTTDDANSYVYQLDSQFNQIKKLTLDGFLAREINFLFDLNSQIYLEKFLVEGTTINNSRELRIYDLQTGNELFNYSINCDVLFEKVVNPFSGRAIEMKRNFLFLEKRDNFGFPNYYIYYLSNINETAFKLKLNQNYQIIDSSSINLGYDPFKINFYYIDPDNTNFSIIGRDSNSALMITLTNFQFDNENSLTINYELFNYYSKLEFNIFNSLDDFQFFVSSLNFINFFWWDNLHNNVKNLRNPLNINLINFKRYFLNNNISYLFLINQDPDYSIPINLAKLNRDDSSIIEIPVTPTPGISPLIGKSNLSYFSDFQTHSNNINLNAFAINSFYEVAYDYSFQLLNIPYNEFGIINVNIDNLNLNNDTDSPKKLLAYNSNSDVKITALNYLTNNISVYNLGEFEPILIFNLDNSENNFPIYGLSTGSILNSYDGNFLILLNERLKKLYLIKLDNEFNLTDELTFNEEPVNLISYINQEGIPEVAVQFENGDYALRIYNIFNDQLYMSTEYPCNQNCQPINKYIPLKIYRLINLAIDKSKEYLYFNGGVPVSSTTEYNFNIFNLNTEEMESLSLNYEITYIEPDRWNNYLAYLLSYNANKLVKIEVQNETNSIIWEEMDLNCQGPVKALDMGLNKLCLICYDGKYIEINKAQLQVERELSSNENLIDMELSGGEVYLLCENGKLMRLNFFGFELIEDTGKLSYDLKIVEKNNEKWAVISHPGEDELSQIMIGVIPTATATIPGFPTPTLTFTPSPSPTNTPTKTPTPYWTVTPTRTPTRTPTFTPSPTPTPTPIQKSIDLDLILEPVQIHRNDKVIMLDLIKNKNQATYHLKLFVVLQLGEEYWLWPSWRKYEGQYPEENLDYKVIEVPYGEKYEKIFEFIYEGGASGWGTFHSFLIIGFDYMLAYDFVDFEIYN